MSQYPLTRQPSLISANAQTNQENPNQAALGFYVAHIAEEIGGKPVPGVPLRIMGQDPATIGTRVAVLLKRRYPELDRSSAESMPRIRLVSVLLRSSYLMIRFELPPTHVRGLKRRRAFSIFTEKLRTEFANHTGDAVPKIRRRP